MGRYVPEPVPTGDDREANVAFLTAELHRISEAINVKVDRAYGGMFQTTPFTVLLPDTSQVLFDPYDIEIPERPDGVVSDASLGSIAVLTGGAFMVSFTTTVVNIAQNEEWEFSLFKNSIDTTLGASLTPSNQTELMSIGFNIIDNADRGDIYTIVIESPTSSDCDVTNSEFIANRVSESTD